MRFYLTKKLCLRGLSSGNVEQISNSDFSGEVFSKYVMITTSIIPSVERNASEMDKCAKLKSLLEENCRSKKLNVGQYAEMQLWNMDLLIGIPEPESHRAETLRGGFVRLDGLFNGNCLQGLRETSDGTARVKLDLEVQGDTLRSPPVFCLSTKEMCISESSCKDSSMEFPVRYFGNWKSEAFYGFCTITVTIPDEVLLGNYKQKPLPENIENIRYGSINEKILKEEMFSDVTIVAGNGSVIKAHKSFLAAQSSVFFAMFESDMSESRESTIEIPDMTEDGIRSLLQYLYYEDTKTPNENSLVAFELFNAAHKYDIGTLEILMREILLSKKIEWLDMDVAVKMFVFARKLSPDDEQLKKMAIQVLKTHVKNLKQSETYQELFEKDKDAAMELCEYAFAT